MRTAIAAGFVAACIVAAPSFSQSIPLTRVEWSKACPSAPKEPAGAPVLAALASILLPKLVDAAVDHAGAAIKAAADTQSLATQSAPTLEKFYLVTATGDLSPRGDIGCLTVVRAVYKATAPATATPTIVDGIDSLVFRMEAQVVRLPGMKYFQLEPKYLQTGKYELSSFWNSNRDLFVSLTMTALGSADAFASWTFQWQDLPPETSLNWGDLRLRASTSAPLPYPADLADANSAKTRQGMKIAPYVTAMDVLEMDFDKTVANPRPSDLKVAKAELSNYCMELDRANPKLPREARIVDKRCLTGLNDSEALLDVALKAAYKSPPSVTWAQGMCPGYKATDKDSKCCPGFDPRDVTKQCKAKDDAGLPWAENVKGSTYGPFLTSVTFTESRRANKFGLALAGAVTSSADDIKKTLKERLVPAEKRKVAEAADAESRTQRQAVQLADLEVAAAEAILSAAQAAQDAAPDDATKVGAVIRAQIELVRKKIAANTAYRAAGRDVPYPEYD